MRGVRVRFRWMARRTARRVSLPLVPCPAVFRCAQREVGTPRVLTGNIAVDVAEAYARYDFLVTTMADSAMTAVASVQESVLSLMAELEGYLPQEIARLQGRAVS